MYWNRLYQFCFKKKHISSDKLLIYSKRVRLVLFCAILAIGTDVCSTRLLLYISKKFNACNHINNPTTWRSNLLGWPPSPPDVTPPFFFSETSPSAISLDKTNPKFGLGAFKPMVVWIHVCNKQYIQHLNKSFAKYNAFGNFFFFFFFFALWSVYKETVCTCSLWIHMSPFRLSNSFHTILIVFHSLIFI